MTQVHREPKAAQAPSYDLTDTTRSGGRFRLLALAVVVVVAAGIGLLVLRDSGRLPGSSSSPSTSAPALHASAVTPAQLTALSTTVGHPIFWLGPSKTSTYELSQSSNGAIFIRYLPAGVAPGSSKAYLTVGTYPYTGAYNALQQVAKQSGEVTTRLGHGGLAVMAASYPDSVHVAYPGVDYQVEVYAPQSLAALSLLKRGKLAAFGGLAEGSAAGAHTVTLSGLQAFAKSVGHPVYWLGAKKNTTYELTQTQSGQVYLRYLPDGVTAGVGVPYLTVGTYPYPAAFAAVKALSKQSGMLTFQLPHGGLAVIDPKKATSAHLAFPGSDYQVEVYDSNPDVVRKIIASGRLSSLG